MLIYIAGKYTADTIEKRQENIDRAKEVAIACWNAGHTVITPHMNTANLDEHTNLTPQDWYDRTLRLLWRCDALVTVDNWQDSKGAIGEVEYAKANGIPVYHSQGIADFSGWCVGVEGIPPLHITEIRCPNQCDAFVQTLAKMYQVHLSKNSDYSPASVLLTGEIGLVTRLWDKIARLLNLSGFRFSVTCDGYEAPKEPKHESIEDTLMDASVYAIIGLLLRKGKWGN